MSTNSDNHTLVKHKDYQEVEVDYADPESRTQGDPQTSVTPTVIDMDDTVQTLGRQTQGKNAPTPASPNNEAAIIAVPSPIPTSAESRTSR